MPDAWPEDTDFALWELDGLDRDGPACGRAIDVCDHRPRRIHPLEGPVPRVCKLNPGPDPRGRGHARTKSPELEVTLAWPKWAIGWDVWCGRGPRRGSRHWSISQIHSEWLDEYGIQRSDDSLSRSIRHYQVMVAARPQDPEVRRRRDDALDTMILSLDRLQPEKGHETLYVVREPTRKRVGSPRRCSRPPPTRSGG